MSVFNGERFLALATQSILDQTFGDFEFLILDDGSTDGSWTMLQEFAERDQRIRLIRRENKGLVVSLNELIAASTAPLIARMDCDDISMPDRFARQIAFLEANPAYGVVGAQRINIDENGQELAVAAPRYALDHQEFLSHIGKETLLCHASVMMRREPLQSVGGYHAAFRHCEDFDLWLRMTSITQLCSLPDALVYYRYSPDQVSNRHVAEQQIGTAIALAAFHERAAGRPDPTEQLEALPSLDDLDALFGRNGMEREVLESIVPRLLYSKETLRTRGIPLIATLLAVGGDCPGLWRTVIRLALMGDPLGALRLSGILISNSFRPRAKPSA